MRNKTTKFGRKRKKRKLIRKALLLILFILTIGSIYPAYRWWHTASAVPEVYLEEYSKEALELYLAENAAGEKEAMGGYYLQDIIGSPVTYFRYTIKSGDSVHGIADKFGIDEVTILKLNDISIPSMIRVGTVLNLPNQDGIKVALSEGLDKVAEKYQFESDELLRLNSLVSEEGVESVFVPGIHFDNLSKQLMLGEYFRRPTYGRFTSYFGYRRDPWTGRRSYHSGVDIANRRGTYIYAAAPGKVIYTGWHHILGHMIKIKHTSGYVTYYGHLNRFLVQPGKWVAAGAVIGRMGNSGRSTGNHLHYEVRRHGRLVNPMKVTVF